MSLMQNWGVRALHRLGWGHVTVLRPEEPQKNIPRCICMVKHPTTCCLMQCRGKKGTLQNKEKQHTCLPHTDSGRSNEYKQILVPLWERAARLPTLTLLSNVAQQGAKFSQVVFNPVAWLEGYSVPPETLDGKVQSRTSCWSWNKVNPLWHLPMV